MAQVNLTRVGFHGDCSPAASSRSRNSWDNHGKSWTEERAKERRDWQNTKIGSGQFGP
jgi:hypothetical protein